MGIIDNGCRVSRPPTPEWVAAVLEDLVETLNEVSYTTDLTTGRLMRVWAHEMEERAALLRRGQLSL
jgi:hypothetical protein